MIDIVFLGTSCMKPTKERGQASVFLSYKNDGILFDCGEGTQRQLRLANIKPSKITKILLTHWHGDHILGLPGLLQTIGTEDYTGILEIYGPKGSKKFYENMTKSFYYDTALQVNVIEVSDGKFYENDEFQLEAAPLDHRVPTLGYSFIEKDKRRINVGFIKKIGMSPGPLLGNLQKGLDVEWKGKKVMADDATSVVKGKKVVYITDTVLCENCFVLAKDADLLISESVYTEDLKEKAVKHKHMTAMEAAMIANKSGAKKLILLHFSQRFKTTEKIEEEVRTYFKNATCAYDLMKHSL